jgi:hypothetical protein
VVCTRALEFVNLVYSRKIVSICGEFWPDFDGFGLLGDDFWDLQAEGVRKVWKRDGLCSIACGGGQQR